MHVDIVFITEDFDGGAKGTHRANKVVADTRAKKGGKTGWGQFWGGAHRRHIALTPDKAIGGARQLARWERDIE